MRVKVVRMLVIWSVKNEEKRKSLLGERFSLRRDLSGLLPSINNTLGGLKEAGKISKGQKDQLRVQLLMLLTGVIQVFSVANLPFPL